MLDRAARSTVRNFSTLFLVCMVVMLPLEMGYAVLYRDVIEVHELVPFIEELPERQRVRGVGTADLDSAKRARLILTALELALVPVLLSATRRVLDRERDGALPTATDAYRNGLTPLRIGPIPVLGHAGAIGVAVVFSLLVGFAAYQVGRIGSEVFPQRLLFGILGGVESIARSLALPWALVAWIEAGARRAGAGLRTASSRSPFGAPPGRHRRS